MSWFHTWFADEWYMELYAHRDAREAREAVTLFMRTTGLRAGHCSVLDLACGTGRHAFQLARAGYTVVAADLSPTLLAAAQRKTMSLMQRPRLVRADMRHLPFRPQFDAVLQLFTAFGYFHSDGDNAAVVRNVADCLLPGGWYMLDFLNPEHVRRTLVPSSVRCINGIDVLQERWIEADRVEKRIEVRIPGEPRVFRESVRLFSPEEVCGMMEEARLAIKHHSGDYLGGPWTAHAPRSIMFAQKL